MCVCIDYSDRMRLFVHENCAIAEANVWDETHTFTQILCMFCWSFFICVFFSSLFQQFILSLVVLLSCACEAKLSVQSLYVTEPNVNVHFMNRTNGKEWIKRTGERKRINRVHYKTWEIYVCTCTAQTHTKCKQVLFVSIFIFSRTVSSLMVMRLLLLLLLPAMLLVLLLQLLNYIYSFYINLSFNDVNDFIFRIFFSSFSPCTLLNINPMIFSSCANWLLSLSLALALFHLPFSRLCFRLFARPRSFSFSFSISCSTFLHAFSLFFSFVLSPYHHQVYSLLHNTWFFCKYSIYRNWLVDE